ncbi:uncharacterized protein LOC128351554 [Hemicordylus capensis]|uniref:uncharacterized protein LOC128351554 n=1 Tax=Hemicordylus capensis TaxID=884348 RepID=UPI002302D7A7|nr:uncharacterized protein LOC128351554 [Hemicordylus capensis]
MRHLHTLVKAFRDPDMYRQSVPLGPTSDDPPPTPSIYTHTHTTVPSVGPSSTFPSREPPFPGLRTTSAPGLCVVPIGGLASTPPRIAALCPDARPEASTQNRLRTELATSPTRPGRGTRVVCQPQASQGDPAWRLRKGRCETLTPRPQRPVSSSPSDRLARSLTSAPQTFLPSPPPLLPPPPSWLSRALPPSVHSQAASHPVHLDPPGRGLRGGGGTEHHRHGRRRRRSPPASESRFGRIPEQRGKIRRATIGGVVAAASSGSGGFSLLAYLLPFYSASVGSISFRTEWSNSACPGTEHKQQKLREPFMMAVMKELRH